MSAEHALELRGQALLGPIVLHRFLPRRGALVGSLVVDVVEDALDHRRVVEESRHRRHLLWGECGALATATDVGYIISYARYPQTRRFEAAPRGPAPARPVGGL